ncbi:hypothetical protein [Methylocystis rosea]|uniref:hypothetical protein n=1 Tax=Methylocystis rosea TaxID=173366 RepID=UPI0012EB9DD9|nr:hypothetical protein [Methylocystis rosea]
MLRRKSLKHRIASPQFPSFICGGCDGQSVTTTRQKPVDQCRRLVCGGVVWACAYYVASDAIADESAGAGGNSFLLASSLATAGLITAFSLREFFVAYKRLGANEARNRRE